MSKQMVIAALLALAVGALTPMSSEAHGKRGHGFHHGHRAHGHHGYGHRYHRHHFKRPYRRRHHRHHVPRGRHYRYGYYDPFAAVITYGLAQALKRHSHERHEPAHRGYGPPRKPRHSARRGHRRHR